MSTFDIKLIAIITMVIDHIGLFFFPGNIYFPLIGRLSFPLFAWLIANGAYHTHNSSLYLKRLLLCAVISQVPFFLASRLIDPTFWLLNAVFTLSMGLTAILLMRATSDMRIRLVVALIAATAAQIASMDYGAMGVFLVLSCYFFFKRPKLLLLSQACIFLGDFIARLVVNKFVSLEIFGFVAIFFMVAYNNKLGPRTKYLFYVFYPLHYVLLYLAKLLI